MSQELKEILKLAREYWDKTYADGKFEMSNSPYICDNIGRAHLELLKGELVPEVDSVYQFIRSELNWKWDVPEFLGLRTDFWNSNWREGNKIQAVIDFRIQLWDKIFAKFGVNHD